MANGDGMVLHYTVYICYTFWKVFPYEVKMFIYFKCWRYQIRNFCIWILILLVGRAMSGFSILWEWLSTFGSWFLFQDSIGYSVLNKFGHFCLNLQLQGVLMTTALVYSLEMLCYSGNILSGIIAFNIWRMQEKTHINKLFLVYFAIDCLIGILEPYFLFKIEKERLALLKAWI